MTRPIFEPSLSRKDAELNYGVQQLFRRPAPPGAAMAIEWVQGESFTDLGTTETPLVFSGGGSFDPGPPTFAFNGSGNLEIAKDGVYELSVWETNDVVASNVVTRSTIVGEAISGENADTYTPATFNGGGGQYAFTILRIDIPAVSDTAFSNPIPDWAAPLAFTTGTFPGAGPCEIEFRAVHEEDGTGVATAFPRFHLWCHRLGDSF